MKLNPGPWGSAEISAFGEKVGLWSPDIPESESTFVAYYPKEEVWYFPHDPWPNVLGTGHYLKRISKFRYEVAIALAPYH